MSEVAFVAVERYTEESGSHKGNTLHLVVVLGAGAVGIDEVYLLGRDVGLCKCAFDTQVKAFSGARGA